MKHELTLRWKTLGFLAIVAVGILVAIMPSRLAGASLETRLAEYVASIPADGFAVKPATLASWIGSSKPLALVDVRDHWEYDEWHVDGAEHVSPQELLSPEGVKKIPADRPVVVLGRNGPMTGQAVAVLRLAGREAYALDGGLEAFWREVLTPASLDGSIPDAERPTVAARRVAWRAMLLGTATGSATASSPRPTTAPPSRSTAPAKPAVSRGKGC